MHLSSFRPISETNYRDSMDLLVFSATLLIGLSVVLFCPSVGLFCHSVRLFDLLSGCCSGSRFAWARGRISFMNSSNVQRSLAIV